MTDNKPKAEPIIGIVLLEAEHDSHGDPIDPLAFYHVAKDHETGKIIIVPSNKKSMRYGE